MRIALLEPIAPAPEPRVPLTLVQAVLKGDKMDDVVRDATMMGVAAIEPIVTAHTIVKRPRARATHAAERWRRVAIASAKQCRRASCPPIAEPRRFARRGWRRRAHGLRLLLVEPSAAERRDVLSLRVLEAPCARHRWR